MDGENILAYYLKQIGLNTAEASEEWDQWDNLITGGDPQEGDDWDNWGEWDQHIEEVDPDDEPDIWDPDNW